MLSRLFASLALTCGTASAAGVVFSSVVTTFDQGAPYDVAASNNGTAFDNLGWGVFGGQTSNQAAVYTAAAPFSGNMLSVFIPQFFGDNHYSQEFRISTTTDATPSLAGSWTEWAPPVARATNGLSLTALGSNRFGVGGSSYNGRTGFHLMAPGSFSGVTGVRLELLAGAGNLGAAPNGNLVISEFVVSTNESVNLALGAPVTSSAPTWPGQPAFLLTDGVTGGASHPDQDAFAGFSYTVDLEGSYALTNLELVNRGDGCCTDRLRNYRVEVLSDLMTTLWSGDIRTDNTDSGVNGIDNITAASGTGTFTGRYIRVTNLSNEQYNPQIAELRAFGSAVPEPGVSMLGLVAAAGLMARRRRMPGA